MNLLLTHTGPNPLPEYLSETLINLISVVSNTKIIFLANDTHRLSFNKIVNELTFKNYINIEFVSIESIEPSSFSIDFRLHSKLDKNFRNGFWFFTSDRFFVIADFLEQSGITNCIHVENDVVLYFDPSSLTEAFSSFAEFAVPLDRSRAIPGIVWIKNSLSARKLTQHMLQNLSNDDMMTIGEFCINNPEIAKPLPTIPISYAIANGLDISRYCQGLDIFGGIFDGAAIGQYLGGVHWLNSPENTRFFINENSDLHLNRFNFQWKYGQSFRYPAITYENITTKVMSVHAHSKDLSGVSPLNAFFTKNKNSIITLKGVTELGETTLHSTETINQTNRSAKNTLMIPEKVDRNFFNKRYTLIAPDSQFISKCNLTKGFAVHFSHLSYFKQYIAPRMRQSYYLITYSTDNPTSSEDIPILNSPKLIAWYSFSSTICHSKIRGVPFGVTSSYNPDYNEPEYLLMLGTSLNKENLLLACISKEYLQSDHELNNILDQLRLINLTPKNGLNKYGADLARSKFVLCPGFTSNPALFWQAQYLNTIPIIKKSDWLMSYSNLPLLMIDRWVDLLEMDLEQEYIKISTTAFDRSILSFDNLKQEINNLK